MTSVVRGAAGTLIGQWCKLIIQLVGIAVLSRLLEPAVFGVYAVVLAIAGIAAVLGDLGLSLAAVQAPTLSREQADNLFWVNSVVGLCASAIVVAFALPAQAILDVPGISYPMQILSIVFLINGAAAQFKAHLNRKMKFGRLAIAEVVGQAAGLASAIVLALNGGGVWSLVVQQIAAVGITLAVLLYVCEWFPRLPNRRTSVRSFLSFGVATSGTQIVNYISTNLDVVIISRVLGAAIAGVYSRAFQLFALPLQQIATPLTRVAVPVLARAGSTELRNKRICQAQLVMSYVLLPILSFAAATSGSLVAVLLGPGWEDAAVYLPILALGGLFQSMGYVYYWTFLACDKMNILFACELVGRTCMIALMILLARYGALWVAGAYSLGLMLIWILTTAWGIHHVTISRRMIIAPTVRPLILAIVVYLVAQLSSAALNSIQVSPAVQLVACGVGALIPAVAMLRWIPSFSRDCSFLYSLLARLRATGHRTTASS